MISFLYAHEFEASKPFEKLHLHDKLEVHTHFGWESKYVLEGRDSLDGGSYGHPVWKLDMSICLEECGMVVHRRMIFVN